MNIAIRSATAALLSLVLALSAGPAFARPFNVNANGSLVPAGSPIQQSQSATTIPVQESSPTIVRITPRDAGFDWGDAGIGAAGALALSAIALGGGLAFSQRRGRHSTA